jgi:hypothetical protein
MNRILLGAALAFAISGTASAAEPDATKFPNLNGAHKALSAAKGHMTEAEEYHKDKGTLGGNGAKAVEKIEAALKQVDEAVEFAEQHKGGKAPGKVTAKEPKGKPSADDRKWPNLGAANHELQMARFHLEAAAQYHKTTGGLGDHAKNGIKDINGALGDVRAAERFADKAEKKAPKGKGGKGKAAPKKGAAAPE